MALHEEVITYYLSLASTKKGAVSVLKQYQFLSH